MATILPTNITELQLDYIIVPMDQRISSKFQKKLKPLNLLQLDIQELMELIQTPITTQPRCVIFIRPHCVTQMPEIYKQALNIFSEFKLPYIEISEQVFDYLLTKCDQEQLLQTTYSATLQGLPQEQIAQLTVASGYANCSSASFGFGNSVQQIRQSILPIQQTNSFIQTMIFVAHDFGHNFSPLYSDQMRCDQSIGLQLVVPQTFYQPKQYCDSYSPIQILPPLCDDPTNSHYYLNDCKPVGCYFQQLKSLPVPRLLIRTHQFLPTSEVIVMKSEDAVKTAQELASLYYQSEQLTGIAVNSVGKILFDACMQQWQLARQIQESIQQIKNGTLKPVNDEFICANSALKLQNDVVSTQQLQFTDPVVKFSKNKKQREQYVVDLLKLFKSALNRAYFKCEAQDQAYIQNVLQNINKDAVYDVIEEYLKFYEENATTQCDFVMDSDELEVIIGQQLQEIIFKRLLCGYFSTKLTPDYQMYQNLGKLITGHLIFGSSCLPQGTQTIENTTKLSAATIKIIMQTLSDPITINSQVIQKPYKLLSTHNVVTLFHQLVYIQKILKQKQFIPKESADFNQYYCPKVDPLLNQPEQECSDEEEQNCKTNRDRFKNLKLQEDTSKGKCSVCPLVYNNYKEHCRSQIHRQRYLEALKQEKLLQPLQDLMKKTQIKNQIQTVFANLCNFISAKLQKNYKFVAEEINEVLTAMGYIHIYVDPDDIPRGNSPTCRSEKFREWRENILKDRMSQFEKMMNSELDKKQLSQIQTTISFGVEEQMKAHRINVLHNVLDELLKDVQVHYSLESHTNKDEFFFQDEIPEKPFALDDVIPANELYGSLAQVVDQVELIEKNQLPQSAAAHSHPNITPAQFQFMQESMQNTLSLKFSKNIYQQFEKTFEYCLNKQPQTYQQENKTSLKQFVQHLRCELDRVEIGEFKLQTNCLQKLLSSTLKTQQKLNFDLESIKLTQLKMIIPPVYQKIQKTQLNALEKVELFESKISQLPQQEQSELVIQTDLNELIKIFADHRADFQNINDFCSFQDSFSTISDDLQICETNSRLKQLTRSNSLAHIGAQLSEDQISLRLLHSEPNLVLPLLNQKKSAQQLINDQFEETFTEYSHTAANVKPTPQIQVLNSGSAQTDFVRGFDFDGQYLTQKNINVNAMKAAHGAIQAYIGPDGYNQAQIQMYDNYIYGVLSQIGAGGVDSAQIALISQAVFTRLEQKEREGETEKYVRAHVSSRTVERALVKDALWEVK
ncbi:Conserved_hypothetical protein [Hexamita inflata]|uniref:Uncharacterized protein n=1 Tax=Hexamita inflata TaxID=28002 RepID=A0AA86QNT1_9EUKA|nr:Conserved hypothetical protein [Hexamita inflata]